MRRSRATARPAPGFRNFGIGIGRTLFCEAAAALLFFGALIHQPELIRAGREAVQELKALGYTIAADGEPVRIHPARTGGDLSGRHAAGWRPGMIFLREEPEGGLPASVYLRHELMHEAVFRTCGGRMPLWAREMAAIAFSGELSGRTPPDPPPPSDLDYVKTRIRTGAPVDARTYRTLSALAAAYEWPSRPCAVSETIRNRLRPDETPKDAGFAYILIHMMSGRIYESSGDMEARFAPGSLLKIPYAASLTRAPEGEIGRELAESDTEALEKRAPDLDADRYRFLVSPIARSDFKQNRFPKESAVFIRSCLGERAANGMFPAEADLGELARMLRASLLYRPGAFSGLIQNGWVPGSTLFGQSPTDKKILKHLNVLSKTGTISDEQGNPLAGHFMAAWPAGSPLFLAVFRTTGNTGASNLPRASRLLAKWAGAYPPERSAVRVSLLSLVPRNTWEIRDECPGFETPPAAGGKTRVSLCGRFTIFSRARGSREERRVAGILTGDGDGRPVVLTTDPETYADAVMSAEAAHLKGEAEKALRAAVVWNGVHGAFRHPEIDALCDSTHCMVFMGNLPDEPFKQGVRTDPVLLERLDRMAGQIRQNWLMFSRGGDDRWERRLSSPEMRRILDEPEILDIRRERNRSGEIFIHLMYPDTEETVSCEVFRNRAKLPSCPHRIRRDDEGWGFEGVGRGHGQGLSVTKAEALAAAGYDATAILTDAYSPDPDPATTNEGS